MTTITIQTNNDYGQKLYRKLKADKNLKKVVINDKPFQDIKNEIELIVPGSEVGDASFYQLLKLLRRVGVWQ